MSTLEDDIQSLHKLLLEMMADLDFIAQILKELEERSPQTSDGTPMNKLLDLLSKQIDKQVDIIAAGGKNNIYSLIEKILGRCSIAAPRSSTGIVSARELVGDAVYTPRLT